jgi:hypothetical protein
MISLSVQNNIYLDEAKPLVIVLDMRDENGVTAHLAWQSANVAPNATYNAGFSWIVPYDPVAGGTYSARTFTITGLGNDAQALSNVVESHIEVSQ